MYMQKLRKLVGSKNSYCNSKKAYLLGHHLHTVSQKGLVWLCFHMCQQIFIIIFGTRTLQVIGNKEINWPVLYGLNDCSTL